MKRNQVEIQCIKNSLASVGTSNEHCEKICKKARLESETMDSVLLTGARKTVFPHASDCVFKE